MNTILSWISVIIGIAGLSYGIYQGRQKHHIERLASLQAWEVFQSAYQALGWFNNAQKETDINERNTILREAHARLDSHYTKTIHNIYTHLKRVTPELIDKWIKEGRIEEHSRRDFLRQIGEMDKVEKTKN